MIYTDTIFNKDNDMGYVYDFRNIQEVINHEDTQKRIKEGTMLGCLSDDINQDHLSLAQCTHVVTKIECNYEEQNVVVEIDIFEKFPKAELRCIKEHVDSGGKLELVASFIGKIMENRKVYITSLRSILISLNQ